MKDFRMQVVDRPLDTRVAEELRTGNLTKALRCARPAGIVVSQEDIDAIAKAMFRAGRTSELLAMIGKFDVRLPYDARELLLRAFKAGDYHGFLKQAHRLGAAAGLESTIWEAIAAVERNAPQEADAWRRKFRLT